MKSYDVIVIGGGTAGLGAYRKAISLGKKALIIEGNDFVTTCADVGCMPSKLLIAAAENMHEVQKSQQFGIEIGDIYINPKSLFERVRRERDRFVGFVKKGAENIEHKVIGYARFKDNHTVEVNGKLYKAKTFILATGSRPYIPEIFNDIKDEILTNENVFELETIPSRIAVFGAGVIGLELGFAFHHLGSRITLFNRGNHILKLNSEINDYVVQHVQNSFEFIFDSPVTKVEKMGTFYRVYYGDKFKDFDKIIVATGRKPNIDNLGLENTSADTSLYNRATTQLGGTHIFLAGDVNNDITLLHEASKEGVIAGANASGFPQIVPYKRNVLLSVVFSSPQIMQVGVIHNIPEDAIKGQVSFEDQGRSRVMLKNKGLLNIYFDRKSYQLIAAEMMGPDAEHVAHLLAWAMEKNTTLQEMLEFPFYHPVIEEGIRTALRDAHAKINA